MKKKNGKIGGSESYKKLTQDGEWKRLTNLMHLHFDRFAKQALKRIHYRRKWSKQEMFGKQLFDDLTSLAHQAVIYATMYPANQKPAALLTLICRKGEPTRFTINCEADTMATSLAVLGEWRFILQDYVWESKIQHHITKKHRLHTRFIKVRIYLWYLPMRIRLMIKMKRDRIKLKATIAKVRLRLCRLIGLRALWRIRQKLKRKKDG